MDRSPLLSPPRSATEDSLLHFYLLYFCVNNGACMPTSIHPRDGERWSIVSIIQAHCIPTLSVRESLTAGSKQILLASLSKRLAANEYTDNSRGKARYYCSQIRSWCRVLC